MSQQDNTTVKQKESSKLLDLLVNNAFAGFAGFAIGACYGGVDNEFHKDIDLFFSSVTGTALFNVFYIGYGALERRFGGDMGAWDGAKFAPSLTIGLYLGMMTYRSLFK